MRDEKKVIAKRFWIHVSILWFSSFTLWMRDDKQPLKKRSSQMQSVKMNERMMKISFQQFFDKVNKICINLFFKVNNGWWHHQVKLGKICIICIKTWQKLDPWKEYKRGAMQWKSRYSLLNCIRRSTSLSLSLLHPPPEPTMSDPNAASAYMPAVRFHLILDLWMMCC